MKRAHSLVATMLVLAVALPVRADPGDLDPAFGGDGLVGAFPNGSSGTAVAVDSRGRTVVAGYTLDGEVDVAIARFRRDGTFDPTFGADGRVRLDLGGQDYVFDLALAADDGIALAGRRTTRTEDVAVVVRLDPAGDPHTGFGGTGVVAVDYGKPFQAATAVAFTPTGRLVIGGYTSNGTTSRTAFARLTDAGALDASFHDDGRFVVNLSPGAEQAEDLLVLDSGRIVAAANADRGLLPRAVVVRVLGKGGLDPAFGKGGVAVVDFAPGADAAFALARRTDGALLVAGTADDEGRGSWAVARLRANGTLDGTFGTGGRVLLRFSPTAAEQAFAVSPSGDKVVLAGRIRTKTGGDDLGVVRLRASGMPDPAFGSGDGKVAIDVDGGSDWATGLDRTEDGRLVVGGTARRDTTFRLTVARLRV